LWFSLRTHAAQIWETPLHGQEYVPQQRLTSLANWRDNIPDEPFLKRIGERMSSRFLRGELATSPVTDRAEPDRTTTPQGTNSGPPKRHPSNSEGRLSSLGSSLTPDDSAMLVQNVAEVAAAAATLAIHNSQSPKPTPQTIPRGPPVSLAGPGPKDNVHMTPDIRHHGPPDWEQGNADLAAAGMGGGHDAPNWSRTKSSVILLGATILYAIIAGKHFMYNING
jgi:Ca2+:H+ antiporter